MKSKQFPMAFNSVMLAVKKIMLDQKFQLFSFFVVDIYKYSVWSCHLADTFYEACSSKQGLNPLPDGKILDWSKLKRIADILKCI